MARSKHIHKYHRLESAGVKLFFCALAECNHHMPKHYEMSLLGKKSICWGCNREFILDERAMRDDMPICVNCALGVTESNESKIDELLTPKIFTGMKKCKDCDSPCLFDYCDHCEVFHVTDIVNPESKS